MKLHDPAEEREFLNISAKARAGRPIETGEPPAIGRLIGVLLMPAITSAAITRLLLGHPDKGLDVHWWELIACLILMLASVTGNGRLYGTAEDCSAHSVLPNLPISGEHAMRWIRGRFLLIHFWKIPFICSVISITAVGATGNIWMLVGNIALMTAITASTIMLMEDEWLRRLWVTRVWFYLSLVSVGIMVCLFIFQRHFFQPDRSPEWVVNVLQAVTWIYPPSWAMTGRFGNGGAWLCAIWIGWGFWKWMTWPRVAGFALDEDRDFLVACEDDFEDEDEVAERIPEVDADFTESSPTWKDTGPPTLPAPLSMNQTGWMDRWVDAVIGQRCRLLAGALCDPCVTWTRQTVRLLVIAPFWLLMTWLMMKWLPDAEAGGKTLFFIWIIPFCSAIYFLLPFSNAIPRAMGLCGPGLLQIPFFAGLPVNTRDLLRVSSRITLARSLVMTFIAGAFFSVLWTITLPGTPPWPVLAIVAAFAVFWVFSRPVFITYRLRSACRRRRGVSLLDAAAVLISILLGILWFAGGVLGAVACFAFSTGEISREETGLTLLLAFGGLMGSGLCARAIFEIHHWQVRRGHFDWLHPP